MTAKNQVSITEIHQLKLNLQTTEEQVKQLKSSIASDSTQLQQQIEQAMTKLEKKKLKAK
jgi:hypothetical protein